jgi:pyruvate formate lyase activating enzyme
MAASEAARRSGREATVLNIQRMSTEDGPGLRTTVFLKGCSLACSWCHNPEAVTFKPEVVWHATRCIQSKVCDAVCEEAALSRRDGAVEIDFARCTGCGDCVRQCPSTALELLGASWDLEDLVDEVAKDASYFETSGGGVTVSGGEPGLWHPFVIRFLESCRARHFHTAVDTSGMCSPAALGALSESADLVLYDLKEIDSRKHREFTGQPNAKILSNLISLAERMRQGGSPGELWIRTPLIPGATLSDENLLGIGAFIARHCAGLVSRWELCAFNNLAGDKYRRLGSRWRFEGEELLSAEALERSVQVARRSGVDPAVVVATGRTRFLCDPASSDLEQEAS